MNCTLIMFSPTGGTEKVARLLCAGLGPVTQVIDLSDPKFAGAEVPGEENAVAVIAMPAFGGRMPGPAAERLKLVKSSGLPCVVLGVYGNRAYENLLKEMETVAKADGFRVAAAAAAVAEHTIMHQYATARPDAVDEANLAEMGRKIAEKLSQPWEEKDLSLPGKLPEGKASGAMMVPKAGSVCVECGLCARVCPTGAIDPANVKTADKKKCITCMRCVSRCPHGARTVPAPMVALASLAIKKACSLRKECELYL